MIQLVASDMDGTLLVDHLTIHPENLKAILLLKEKGIPFLICSGRNLEMVDIILDGLDLTCPKILLNGAIVYDEDHQVIERNAIDKRDAKSLLDTIIAQDLLAEIITEQGVFLLDMNKRKTVFEHDLRLSHPELSDAEISVRVNEVNERLLAHEVPDFDTLLADPTQHILKISVMDNKGPVAFQSIRTFIQDNLPDLVVTSSNISNIEINHVHAQKGHALARYAEKKGLDMAKAMAFGDNFNDASMLTLAGYSFAMANAEPEVKALAKYITASNLEGGVAQGIYQFIT